MVQKNEMSARALTMEEMENVNGGYPIKFIDELIGRGSVVLQEQCKVTPQKKPKRLGITPRRFSCLIPHA